MDTIQHAEKILREAEAGLRKLLELAIGEGRYLEVAAVATLADAVAKLGRGAISGSLSSGTPLPKARVRSMESVPPTPVRTLVKKVYPRFLRDDDKLVKIGWSKKAKAEYEHRAPIEVADALVASIRATAIDGQKFAATDVIPIQMGGEQAPDYQTYLALKWLHSEGVITKHGRDRYAIEPGRIGADGLKTYWSRLPAYKSGVSA